MSAATKLSETKSFKETQEEMTSLKFALKKLFEAYTKGFVLDNKTFQEVEKIYKTSCPVS